MASDDTFTYSHMYTNATGENTLRDRRCLAWYGKLTQETLRRMLFEPQSLPKGV